MPILLIQHIDSLKKLIVGEGVMVEEALEKAIAAIETRDLQLAEQVIVGDREIDLKEIDVEEECLVTLAMHQPVAHDLRFIVAVLKINRDLERIGDLAVNIAERAAALTAVPPSQPGWMGLPEMARKAQAMLKQSLDAFVDLDTQLAQKIIRTDDEVDDIHRNIYTQAEQRIQQEPEKFPHLILLLSVARQLERVADHAVNIAEDVIYLTQGNIVRHGSKRKINLTQEQRA